MQRNELSEPELTRIFHAQIVSDLFGGSQRSQHPLLVLVGAQPGAGKTRAGEMAARDAGQPVTPIIGDDLRIFHPEYRELCMRSPSEMPAATAAASGAWVRMAIDYAAEHRLSVLVEGTWREPATTLSTARQFTDAGFDVEAHVVAVAPEESRLSTAERFIHDEQDNGAGRITPSDHHDIAFAGLQRTIRAVSAAAAPIDRLVVRTRNDVQFDEQRRGMASIRGAFDAAKEEWNRQLGELELHRFTQRSDAARAYLLEHHASDPVVQLLVEGLRNDVRYLNMANPIGGAANISGQVAVRGHTRGGHAVSPHWRSLPSR